MLPQNQYHRKWRCHIYNEEITSNVLSWCLSCTVAAPSWKAYAFFSGETASPGEESIVDEAIRNALADSQGLHSISASFTIRSVPLWGRGTFWLICTGHHMVAHLCGSVSNHWSGMKLSWSLAKWPTTMTFKPVVAGWWAPLENLICFRACISNTCLRFRRIYFFHWSYFSDT